MRLLLDSCVWGGARKTLEDAGHDVVWAGEWAKDPGDEEILSIAVTENRILVTLDKDFGELAIVRGIEHCGIMRLVNVSATQQATMCNHILEVHGEEMEAGALVTAEPGRLRIRSADQRE